MKRMAAKAKCIKGYQILAEITMRNPHKLGAFEQLSQKNCKSGGNVAIVGNSIVLAYP